MSFVALARSLSSLSRPLSSQFPQLEHPKRFGTVNKDDGDPCVVVMLIHNKMIHGHRRHPIKIAPYAEPARRKT